MDDKRLPAGAQVRRIAAGEFEHLDLRWGDRADWGKGPWQDEPDRVEWRVPELPGLVCMVARGPSGSWCGYVAVPPGHPLHGKDYSAAEEQCDQLSVHGGLTFADACKPDSPICHVPAPGEPDDVWWLGFDCAHGGDLSPAMRAMVAKSCRMTLQKMDRGEPAPGLQDRAWLEKEASIPDYVPSSLPWWESGQDTYRDVHYVIAETEALAVQIALAQGPLPADAMARVLERNIGAQAMDELRAKVQP